MHSFDFVFLNLVTTFRFLWLVPPLLTKISMKELTGRRGDERYDNRELRPLHGAGIKGRVYSQIISSG